MKIKQAFSNQVAFNMVYEILGHSITTWTHTLFPHYWSGNFSLKRSTTDLHKFHLVYWISHTVGILLQNIKKRTSLVFELLVVYISYIIRLHNKLRLRLKSWNNAWYARSYISVYLMSIFMIHLRLWCVVWWI